MILYINTMSQAITSLSIFTSLSFSSLATYKLFIHFRPLSWIFINFSFFIHHPMSPAFFKGIHFHLSLFIFIHFIHCHAFSPISPNAKKWKFNILRDLLLFLCLLSTCIFANKYFYEDSDCDYSCWGWWWDNRLWIFTLYQILHLRALFKAFSAPFNLLRRIVPTLLGGFLCKGNFCWSAFF